MCGRYFMDLSALSQDTLAMYALPEALVSTPGLSGNCEMMPSCEATALISQGGEIVLKNMRWGFEGEGGLIINARIETIDIKPTFKPLAQKQRCALPAARYFEWRKGDRQKYAISLRDAKVFFLGGLYRWGKRGLEFVVLTQPPVEKIKAIHNRMPLILDTREALQDWLDGKTPLYNDDGNVDMRAEGPEQLRMSF